MWNPSRAARKSSGASPGQVLYIVFGEQPDPDSNGDRIDPIVATFVTREQCIGLEASAPGRNISWGEIVVRDAGEHHLAQGDTVYLAHDTADLSLLPDGREVVEFVTAPSPTAAYYSETKAREAAKCQSVQLVVVGEIGMSGIGSYFPHDA